jgi:hypothetical protein
MPSAAYFRRQADICLQLSLIASNEAVSSRLIAMAKDYQAMSEAWGTMPPDIAARPGAPEGDGNSASLSSPPDPGGPSADS